MRSFSGLLFSFALLFWISLPVAAADADGTGPDAGSNDWLVFNQEVQNYVPYTRSLHENDPALSLIIDLLKYRNYDILIKTRSENHIFINGALHKITLPDQWVILNADSLLSTNKSDDLLLTFYGNEKASGRVVQIGHKKDSSAPQLFDGFASLINIKPKNLNRINEILVLTLMLMVALNGLVLSIAPLFYRSFMNPLHFFKKDNRDEKTIYTNPFSTESFFMILQVGLLMTPFCLFIAKYLNTRGSFDFFLSGNQQFSGLLIEFSEILLFCLAVIYLKFFSIKITGNLLSIEAVSNQHFMKTLQSAFHFYLLVAIIILFSTIYTPTQLPTILQFLVYLAISFYFIRFILLYFVMNVTGPFINLYLFSYLCIVEIIPLTIGIKYIL
jgi:hypothetical protein